MATPAQPPQLTDLIAKVRRHWLIVATCVLIGAGLGAAASYAMPKSYDATVRIEVNPINSDDRSSPEPAANMPTEEERVTSYRVAADVADSLPSKYAATPEQVQKATAVVVPENSWVLVVTYTGTSADGAAAGANALAQAYLTARQETADKDRERRTLSAREQLAALQKQLATTPEANRTVVSVQIQAAANKLASLSNIDTNPGAVIGAATAPTSAAGPGLVPLVVGGGFLGLLIGVPIALSRRGARNTVTDVSGLELLRSPVIVDGTFDQQRADTWDTTAFKLKLPAESPDSGYVVVVDAADAPGRIVAAGQELADALGRLGRRAQFLEAADVDQDLIDRGWPTDERATDWAGETVVIDTTGLAPAQTATIAGRCDSMVVTRTSSDSATELKELAAALKARHIDLTAAVLFKSR